MAYYISWSEAMLAIVGAVLVTLCIIGSVSTAGVLG